MWTATTWPTSASLNTTGTICDLLSVDTIAIIVSIVDAAGSTLDYEPKGVTQHRPPTKKQGGFSGGLNLSRTRMTLERESRTDAQVAMRDRGGGCMAVDSKEDINNHRVVVCIGGRERGYDGYEVHDKNSPP